MLDKNNKREYVDLVQNSNGTDYVKDGRIVHNASMQPVLVSSSSDLSLLTEYEPGTIAYTAGFNSIWQKAPDGTWAEFQ